jgi:hypothetical protein
MRVFRRELEELLIGESFYRACIDDFLALRNPVFDCEFGWERFPGTGMRRNENMLIVESRRSRVSGTN